MDRVASRELPRSLEGVPDLLTFSPIFVSEKWRKLDHNMGNATELYDAMVIPKSLCYSCHQAFAS